MTNAFNTTNSQTVFSAAQELMPGGVSSPVRAFKSVNGDPIIFDRVKGPYAWDIDGNRFIDYVGSWGPAICGHSHPEVVESVTNQVENGTHFGALSELELTWASKVQNLIPSAKRVRFTSSGTEATLLACLLYTSPSPRDS